jgi:hypothetical protein
MENNNNNPNQIPIIDTPKTTGRRKLVSPEIIEKIKIKNHAANLAGASISTVKIAKQIEEERLLDMGPGANLDCLKPLSRRAALRYVAEIAAVVIRHPDVQNKRRLEAKGDIYNQISLAAVVHAILGVLAGQKSLYTPHNIHCLDAMSVLLFHRKNDSVRSTNEAIKELKKRSRSSSTTVNQPQCRTVKCYFDTSANGNLNVAVISITDNMFVEDTKWFLLDSDDKYELWLLLIKKKRKLKIIMKTIMKIIMKIIMKTTTIITITLKVIKKIFKVIKIFQIIEKRGKLNTTITIIIITLILTVISRAIKKMYQVIEIFQIMQTVLMSREK